MVRASVVAMHISQDAVSESFIMSLTEEEVDYIALILGTQTYNSKVTREASYDMFIKKYGYSNPEEALI